MKLTRLGPYEIGKPLGKGGMGSVFAATDLHTGQRVAIKALSPHLAMADGFRERFEAEIESLKKLRHEGIVRLYGYGEQDGVLFYSMEVVDGVSLEDELRAGRRFNWREVTSIAVQLSRALKHAHDHGIVHRDIKPANILLFDDDQVKLADFGIARLFGTTQLTTAGGVLGTADYMSPEQAEGRPVTARCDQYSLGGVMYALLTGRPPFVATNLPQMLQLQRFAQPEPVRRYAPDTPEQLERVISQLLAKDPTDRYPNTQVLARHLQAMARALSRPAADDFALTGVEPAPQPRVPGVDESLAIEPTLAETDPDRADRRPVSKSGPQVGRVVSLQDAATVAAEESAPSRPSVNLQEAASLATEGTPPAAGRAPRFTTLEEEQARLGSEYARPWMLVAAQLGALAGVLAGIGGVAFYLSRPPSADHLYETISSHVETNDDASFSSVGSEVEEFLSRYPDDPRADELQQYKERIELDRLERKLLRQARGSGVSDASLLPVEQLYLQAVQDAQSSPENTAALLQSLIDLYGPTAGNDQNAQVAAVVQLANSRLAALREQMAEQRQRQLKSLQERLAAAGQLMETDSQQAAGMYRAIIGLHERDDWAATAVDEARQRLKELGSE
jgi:eukaryotic-like serine/threonine-protein kinase